MRQFLHAYDALREGLGEGARVAVIYGPHDDDETPRAWAIRRGDRVFFDYEDMAADYHDNRSWGLVVGIAMGAIGLFLGVLATVLELRESRARA